ncbi:MAG: hypothetical protein AAF203_10965, partial [Pseudomonadota bacterium]
MNRPTTYGWSDFDELKKSIEHDACLNIGEKNLQHFQIKRLFFEEIAKKYSGKPIHYFEFGVFRGRFFRFVQSLFHLKS